MLDFIKGFIKGFTSTLMGLFITYSILTVIINIMLWTITDESEQAYQPVFNLFTLM